MHGFDHCGCVVCPESECMVLTNPCVAVWFVQRVNAEVTVRLAAVC